MANSKNGSWENLPKLPDGTTAEVFDVLLRERPKDDDLFPPGWIRVPNDGLASGSWVIAAGFWTGATFGHMSEGWEWGLAPYTSGKKVAASEMERFAVLPDGKVVLPRWSLSIEVSHGCSVEWETAVAPVFGKLEKLTDLFSFGFLRGLEATFAIHRDDFRNRRLRCVNVRTGRVEWTRRGFDVENSES